MGLFDKLVDKREKKDYVDVKRYFFSIAQMQRIQYPEQFGDIEESAYRAGIVGIFAAYLDTKPKQKCVISSYGQDMFTSQIGCVSREVKENVLPVYKDAYKYYTDFVKTQMNSTVNATTVRTLAAEMCHRHDVTPDATRLNAIAMDINTMMAIIDATFDTFRFV